MNHYLVFVYGVCFALIGGAAFAMMWANIMSLDMKPQPPTKPRRRQNDFRTREIFDDVLAKVIWDRVRDLVPQTVTVDSTSSGGLPSDNERCRGLGVRLGVSCVC